MYVVVRKREGGDFFSDEKKDLIMMAANTIFCVFIFCFSCLFRGNVFFSVGGDADDNNIRAAQQNEVGCILAQNTICKIT